MSVGEIKAHVVLHVLLVILELSANDGLILFFVCPVPEREMLLLVIRERDYVHRVWRDVHHLDAILVRREKSLHGGARERVPHDKH